MKPKRKSDKISPIENKGPKPKRQQKGSTGKQPGKQSVPIVQPNMAQPHTPQQSQQPQSLFFSNIMQSGQYGISPPLYNQLMNMNSVASPAQVSQSSNMIQTPGANLQSSDLLQTLLDRLDKIDNKLGQLGATRTKVENKLDAINQRLNSMDMKISEIEKSQNLICEQYDTVNSVAESNKVNIEKLQADMHNLRTENSALKAKSESLTDDLTDMKCRSMKDNLLFFGIPEGLAQIPGERFVPHGLENTVQNGGFVSSEMEINFPLSQEIQDPQSQQCDGMERSTGKPVPSYSSVASGEENCKFKVYDFCNKVLKMHEPEKCINIIVAHRIGRSVPGRIRPIVARLESDSKMAIKNALKTIKLKDSDYNVSDQYPQEVKEKRKALIPELIKARAAGKTAFLRRDKLIIQENRYPPRGTSD